MVSVFNEQGVRFEYPTNWNLDRQTTDSGWTVTLQSPGSAFLFLVVNEDMPSMEQMLEATLTALREDYTDLEVYDHLETIAGQPAMGHDMHFTSLDLTNTCCTRCFYSPAGTILMMWQANDLDLEEVDLVFQAICASLSLEEKYEE